MGLVAAMKARLHLAALFTSTTSTTLQDVLSYPVKMSAGTVLLRVMISVATGAHASSGYAIAITGTSIGKIVWIDSDVTTVRSPAQGTKVSYSANKVIIITAFVYCTGSGVQTIKVQACGDSVDVTEIDSCKIELVGGQDYTAL